MKSEKMSSNITETTLEQILAPFSKRVEADIATWLVEPSVPDQLAEGMRYCVEDGKRLRPALVYLSALAAGGNDEDILVRRAAVAVELVHVYSLVHDDLPSMDNDITRRGKPTAHVKYGEAMAILIGDGLLTRAMGLLAESGHPSSHLLVAELAASAGASGMVAGQVADMDLCTIPDGREGVEYIIVRKTAALIQAASRMGAIAAGGDDSVLDALGEFALKMGMAFQVFDDLLDKDEEEDRSIVAEIGMEEAIIFGEKLTTEALSAVTPLGYRADTLKQLATLLVNRKY